jgi:glycosyltransferase involved in cell wall biosynthesis
MLEGKTVAVVIPAYNEEALICETLKGIPSFVDNIVVIDDLSQDSTRERVEEYSKAIDSRVILIKHEKNGGVGDAIISGYKWARENKIDATVVVAADNQMEMEDMETLCMPVVKGELDYSKANRLLSGEAWSMIPHYRYLGNAALSLFTKIASGYWHVADSQTGYTVISLEMLDCLDLDRIYKRYGFPNDMLVHLNIWNARVEDIPSRPIYGVGEKSGIKVRKVVPRISWLLLKGFFWRMKEKYLIRDFHPLVFFYMLGGIMTLLGGALGLVESYQRIINSHPLPVASVVLVALLLISGLQLLLFGAFFDMENGKDLRAEHDLRRLYRRRKV